MSLIDKASELLGYLVDKRSELADLDLRDAVMAKAILDVHRKRTGKQVVALPLFALKQIHLLDRENALEATQRRVDELQIHRQELLEAGTLTCDLLARYLPSVSWIKVVREEPESYIAFEGNGRIAAMQQVFAPEDGVNVEVEEYQFEAGEVEKILRRLNRVRKMNGLLDET